MTDTCHLKIPSSVRKLLTQFPSNVIRLFKYHQVNKMEFFNNDIELSQEALQQIILQLSTCVLNLNDEVERQEEELKVALAVYSTLKEEVKSYEEEIRQLEIQLLNMTKLNENLLDLEDEDLEEEDVEEEDVEEEDVEEEDIEDPEGDIKVSKKLKKE